MSNHTPGPWTCDGKDWRGEPSIRHAYISGKPFLVGPGLVIPHGICVVMDIVTGPESTEANARLITAAPDYYAALEDFFNSETSKTIEALVWWGLWKAHQKAKGIAL